ncbi:MAG: hypothetical protein IJG60_09160 [Thermoguttaceae bacterium]|nr:hypothetical protein [Thermoguttaceae bacterium]
MRKLIGYNRFNRYNRLIYFSQLYEKVKGDKMEKLGLSSKTLSAAAIGRSVFLLSAILP